MQDKNKKTFEEVKKEIIENNYDKAFLILEDIEENSYGDKNYYTGIIQANKKEYKQAEKSFNKCLEINKNHIGAYLSLSELYNIQNKHEKAKDILEKAYNIDPNNINVNSYLSGLYMHLNLYERAIPHLRIINDKDKNQNIQKLLILSLEETFNRKIEEENYEKAKVYAEELIQINDEYHGGYKLLGIINHKLGYTKNASEFYIKAFQRLSDDINIANLLTHSLIEINDYENAKFTNNKALQIDPNNRLANDLKKEIDKKFE